MLNEAENHVRDPIPLKIHYKKTIIIVYTHNTL